MAVSKIDWPFWLAPGEIEAWQAVALTLSVDPDNMKVSDSSWMHPGSLLSFKAQSFPSTDVKDEFYKRLVLLTRRGVLADRNQFTAGTLSMSSPARHGVQLMEVLVWLQRLGRTPIATELLSVLDRPADEPGASTAYPTKVDGPNEPPYARPAREAARILRAAHPDWTTTKLAQHVQTEFAASRKYDGRRGPVSVDTLRKVLKGI